MPFDGTRPVMIRIKNPTKDGKGFWYWNGATWSSRKEDAKVFACDYDASTEVYRRNFKTAIVINAQPKAQS